MHWEHKTELKKHFRMPRYTGVTLSLLSMMVLASMLLVGRRFSLRENADLRLLVTPELSIAEISNPFATNMDTISHNNLWRRTVGNYS